MSKEKLLSIVKIAFREISSISNLLLNTILILSIISCGACGFTRNPLNPSKTIFVIPPTQVAITTFPADIASSKDREVPSDAIDGTTDISKFSQYSTAFSDEGSNEIRVGRASSLRSSAGTWGLVANE